MDTTTRAGKIPSLHQTEINWDNLDKTKLYVVGAGMFSCVTVALYPVSVVKTRMQVASGDAMRRNALATFKNILKVDGVPGLYRGFPTVIIGAVPTRIIFLTALETTKAASLKLVEPFKLSEPVQAAFANGLAGLSASTCSQAIFVPIDVISQKLMVQGYSGNVRYKGGMDVARKVIKADGIRGLYRGFGLSVMTYAPSSAVWWASYGSSQRIIWSALGHLHNKEEAPSQMKIVGVLEVPVAVIDYIDRARRHCLWRGSDSNAKLKPLVAWKKCTKPKRKGGLGIINLRSQNKALLLKHLDKFYNRKSIPWVNLVWNAYYSQGQIPHASADRGSFWWRDILKLCDLFRGIAKCNIGNGSTVLFWSDAWNDNILETKFPRLFSFARNKNTSVASFLSHNTLEDQFYLPLSEQAFQEFQEFQVLIQGLQIDSNTKDTWDYIWGSKIYSSSKCYNLPYKNFQPPTPFLWIWKSKCCNKLRVFSWLLLMDRLNTRNILRRKKQKLQGNNYNCVLCNGNIEESAFHLFFSCSFSQACWHHLGVSWDLSKEFFQMIQHAKLQFQNSFFMETFIIAAWQIWKQRNNFIFDRGRPSFASWKRLFCEEARLQAHKLNEDNRPNFLLYIDALD